MKKLIIIFYVFFLCIANDSFAAPYLGIEFPNGESSFADEVVDYSPGSYAIPPYTDPSHALGVPESSGTFSDYIVSLGNYGSLSLKFTDNSLTTSGNSDLDLYIFEAGNGTENIDVSISLNGLEWVEVGRVTAGATGIDIDAYIDSGVVLNGLYPYVLLKDVGNDYYTGPYAGADINAVGAISSSVPIPGAIWLLSGGLIGLAAIRRKKN